MVKKILIIGYIILATSLTVHGANKWTGPTSPIDPMWGLTGSSLMSECLREGMVETYTPNIQLKSSSSDVSVQSDLPMGYYEPTPIFDTYNPNLTSSANYNNYLRLQKRGK